MNIIDVKKVENLLKSEISTYKISKETGITATTLHRYRSGEGEIKNMRIETAEKLYEMALIEEQKILERAALIESYESESNESESYESESNESESYESESNESESYESESNESESYGSESTPLDESSYIEIDEELF